MAAVFKCALICAALIGGALRLSRINVKSEIESKFIIRNIDMRRNVKPIISQRTESATPLEIHINYFAGKDERLSLTSMTENLIKLDKDQSYFNQFLEFIRAAIVSLKGGVQINKCPFSTFSAKQAVGVLNHTQHTGIYNADGSFNQNRWNTLINYYTEINDRHERFITKNKLFNFLEGCRKIDNQSDLLGLATRASNGEWNTLFDKCTDYWKEVPNANPEPAMKISTLKEFFMSTPTLFERVTSGELPVPPPATSNLRYTS